MAEPIIDPTAAAPPAKKSKIKLIAVIGGIVAVQCALGFFFFPSGSSAAKADSHKDRADKPAEHGEDHGSKAGENREVDLGDFSLTTFNPNSNTTLIVDFHLYGTVAAERDDADSKGEAKSSGEKKKDGEKGADDIDNTKFGRLYKRNRHRFRDQVIVVIRNAEMTDLSDPGLGLIKRQILAKTNSLLGEPLLKEVIFSEFAVVEQ